MDDIGTILDIEIFKIYSHHVYVNLWNCENEFHIKIAIQAQVIGTCWKLAPEMMMIDVFKKRILELVDNVKYLMNDYFIISVFSNIWFVFKMYKKIRVLM